MNYRHSSATREKFFIIDEFYLILVAMACLSMVVTPYTLVVTCLLLSCCHGCSPGKDISYSLTPQMQPAAATVSEILTFDTTKITVCVGRCFRDLDCEFAVHVRYSNNVATYMLNINLCVNNR